MHMSELLFIFGLPGVGKSYVADILNQEFGYFIHNGDDDLPMEMKAALFQKSTITDHMRHEFVQQMIQHIKKLIPLHPKIAIHQTLVKEFMREALIQAFPHAKFILVQCETEIRETRYQERKYFNLGLPYLRKMSDLFDPPKIPFTTLINQSAGSDTISKNLQKLL